MLYNTNLDNLIGVNDDGDENIQYKVYKETNEYVEVNSGEYPDSSWSFVVNNTEGHEHVISVYKRKQTLG